MNHKEQDDYKNRGRIYLLATVIRTMLIRMNNTLSNAVAITNKHIGKASCQTALNERRFTDMAIGTHFDVRNVWSHNLHRVCVKTGENEYMAIGDGRRWRVDQSDITSRSNYLDIR